MINFGKKLSPVVSLLKKKKKTVFSTGFVHGDAEKQVVPLKSKDRYLIFLQMLLIQGESLTRKPIKAVPIKERGEREKEKRKRRQRKLTLKQHIHSRDSFLLNSFIHHFCLIWRDNLHGKKQ